jgi:hypothetical protein
MQNCHATSPSTAELARLVNCLDEHGFATLAGVKRSTLEAWRKRGRGPEYVLLGCNYLYPLKSLQTYILDSTRTRTGVAPSMGVL